MTQESTTVTIALTIEYDGQAFHGWQFQPHIPTVQGVLQETLSLVLREPIGPLHAAGRTDAGVHARGQVVSFTCTKNPDLARLTNAVSSILKGRLSVISASIVPATFHPRRSSTGREYMYQILNRPSPAVLQAGRVWHIVRPLDLETLRAEAACLVGTHDFSSFRGATCSAISPIKTIQSAVWHREGELLIFTVVGGFLQHQVRIMVGTMVDRARGKLSRCTEEILGARQRTAAGITAPPYGLTLNRVIYPSLAARTGALTD
jgi:tRNA pseudouridine38-40 synthase